MINEALEAIDKAFNKLGKEFISIFKHDDYKGLRIVIAKEIITGNDVSVKDLSGYFFSNYTYYNIIITKGEFPYEKILYHEMMHAIDYNASVNKYDMDGKWYDYNPKDFEYNVKHYTNKDRKYTTDDSDVNDVYFVDSYSQTNQSEDRARIFENICYVDGENIIKKYPNLLKKAEYIKNELIKYYPLLKNSTIFNNIEK